ncbi:unnamed protein product [Kuraishia capsulata CBS 1993]|uniref:Uncharacterized protein n=1 Tax=Kuraishia capsulata CBS 1993 TaxID=1382522 RepID=W6MIA8_9ASCO|nr:uncharacterized protein KUCA_T00001847001 [Kuraishia capsulata CBS 1993]CDK25876.1 unnamed protein product [Kuraishia capsulata CBS 1993]
MSSKLFRVNGELRLGKAWFYFIRGPVCQACGPKHFCR